jgi:hypothetical protein
MEISHTELDSAASATRFARDAGLAKRSRARGTLDTLGKDRHPDSLSQSSAAGGAAHRLPVRV